MSWKADVLREKRQAFAVDVREVLSTVRVFHNYSTGTKDSDENCTFDMCHKLDHRLQHILGYCVWKKSCTSWLDESFPIAGRFGSTPKPLHCNIGEEEVARSGSGKGKNPAPPMSPQILTSVIRPILQWWGAGESNVWLKGDGMTWQVVRWCRIFSNHRQNAFGMIVEF